MVDVVLDGGTHWSCTDEEILDPRYDKDDRERRIKERVRLGVLAVVGQAYDVAPSPWGILTGVRPTKLVHRMRIEVFTKRVEKHIRESVYGLSSGKIDLLLPCGSQTGILPSQPQSTHWYLCWDSFCPTRCSYCSFLAYPLESHGHLFEPFYKSLCVEIEAIGGLLKDLGIAVESVYLGGGTPTTIQGEKLVHLLELVRTHLLTPESREFTVEAGRPETLSLETLHILAEFGVDRISINPQSMHNETLPSRTSAHGGGCHNRI